MTDDFRFEKLNGENFRYWSMRVTGLLVSKGCFGAIDPGYGPEAEWTPTQITNNRKAMSTFYMTMTDAGLDDISHCESAKDIWDTLKEIHTQYDTWHGLLLLKDFVTTGMKTTETIAQYMSRRNALYRKVCDAGFKLEEIAQAGFAILGLPKEYEYLSRSLRLDKNDLTLASIKAKLLEEERRINEGARQLQNRTTDDERNHDDVKAFNIKKNDSGTKIVEEVVSEVRMINRIVTGMTARTVAVRTIT